MRSPDDYNTYICLIDSGSNLIQSGEWCILQFNWQQGQRRQRHTKLIDCDVKGLFWLPSISKSVMQHDALQCITCKMNITIYHQHYIFSMVLTHWGRVTHICVSKLTIIRSDNGLSPDRRQAIIWTNTGLLIGPLGTNFSEILIEILTFSLKKMRLNVSSAKRRPFRLGLNVLIQRMLEQNGRHFTDDISKCIFVSEILLILILIPLYVLYLL